MNWDKNSFKIHWTGYGNFNDEWGSSEDISALRDVSVLTLEGDQGDSESDVQHTNRTRHISVGTSTRVTRGMVKTKQASIYPQ